MTEPGYEPRPGPQPDTAGGLLRAAREKQGLHIAALAASIKVTPRKLEALEGNRWDELPDITFARALAQTVCRTLKVDAKPVLDLLPASHVSKLENVAGSLNTPFSARGGQGAGTGTAAIKPMVWAGLALLVAALVVFLMPAQWWQRLTGNAAGGVAPAPATAASEMILTTPVIIGEAVPAAASAVEEPASNAAAAASAAASGATAIAPGPMVTELAGGMMSGDGIQLVIVQSSWVTARDATGRVIVSRLVETGEQLAIEGEPPIKLVIGNAAGVELTYKQKRIDLQAMTSNNVVRMQLPP